MTRLLALAASALTVAACASSIRSAVAPGPPAQANELFLVDVLEAPPSRPTELVSLSVAEWDRDDPLPAQPNEDVVDAMKRVAAAQGAGVLVIERLDTQWRRAFYGLGLRFVEAPPPEPPECTHPEATQALADARRRAQACLALVRQQRPNLQGAVTVAFEIDPFGAARLAATTPDSTRDGQVQACALEAVHRTDFGTPPGLGCRLRLEVAL